MLHTKTLKLRVKDKHAPILRRMARDVNFVWNYLNELSHKSIVERRQWMSAYDLQKYTAGFSKCEGVVIKAATVDEICASYATRRKQFKKIRLNWRVSNPNSKKRSLGWIPFKAVQVKFKLGQIQFAGIKFGIWDSYGLSKYKLRSGNFSQDSRGRWYFNVCVYVEESKSSGCEYVGIDLGLKACATTSDGLVLVGRNYRKYESKLALAQRSNNKKLARSINAKVRNKRKDDQHKFSTNLVRRCSAIFVGNVSSNKLVKTKMAKSTLDAGWGQLKMMLENKCQRAGVVFEVLNESYTTQTCSCCGVIPDSSPKGMAGLRIREWACGNCGTVLDRDVNAARNILAAGLRRLEAGTQPS